MLQIYEKTSEMQRKIDFSLHFRVHSKFGKAKFTKILRISQINRG